MPPPTVALVGATGTLRSHLPRPSFVELTSPHLLTALPPGLVGSALLPAFVQALKDHQFASLRILTASPSSPALSLAHSVPGVEIIEISFGDQRGLAEALRGVEVLVSAMGAAETKQGKYQGNKQKLLDAAVEAGVKVRTSLLLLYGKPTGRSGAGLCPERVGNRLARRKSRAGAFANV